MWAVLSHLSHLSLLARIHSNNANKQVQETLCLAHGKVCLASCRVILYCSLEAVNWVRAWGFESEYRVQISAPLHLIGVLGQLLNRFQNGYNTSYLVLFLQKLNELVFSRVHLL